MELNHLQANNSWAVWQRILFRFLFAYVFLYCFSFPLYYIPGAHIVTYPIGNILQELSVWFGKTFLSIETVPTDETGSGDTLLYWLVWLTKLTLAVSVTIIWSVIDWKRKTYGWLKKVLITYTRYYLALILLSYGLFKIVPTQFDEPTIRMLMQRYGDSSPMGLLWNFMGYSTAYQVFGGIAEVLGAVLLLFRRTTLLGALVLVGVMTNVVMLNFCFDVPVKLASTHYLLFSMGLAIVYGKPLVNLFLLNKPTEAMEQTPLFKKKIWFWSSQTLKFLLVGFVFYSMLSSALEQKAYMDKLKQTTPYSGVYDVLQFSRDGNSDSVKNNYHYFWRRLIVEEYRPDKLVVEQVNGNKLQYTISWDTVNQAVSGFLTNDTINRLALKYTINSREEFNWVGEWNDDSVRLSTKLFATDSMLLQTRKFRWVNPFPFNR